MFVGCYFVMSIAYGLFIESYQEEVDPWTRKVSQQIAVFLSWTGDDVFVLDSYRTRSCILANEDKQVISVFEGCNGLNVMILFISFLVAFKGPLKKFVGFAIIGVLLIHLVNIGRVAMLYYVAEYLPEYMYFTHKYLFTAVIYLVVFVLWYLWVSKINANPKLSKISNTA